ncbi:MAG: hypothetical protein USCGTAYLOR_01104 [Chromatiales bacterium USCg_Taylor]|nr:MAG: hypothetical protein USCGTAYLOR_01104 [Chromatiales bacterium USCg_Taylor]
MKPMRLLKYSVLAASIAALGGSLVASNATAEGRDGRLEVITFAQRGDIKPLPRPLKRRLIRLAKRPHTYVPMTLFSEADQPSQLFQFYLLDTTGFQPNVFTSVVPGINDTAIATGANAANGGLPTIGAVRLALEPKPGLPTDPNDPRAFIDIFTDISGLFVINNESGWYEGWMIQDIPVPRIAEPGADGTAQFGSMTPEDAAEIAARGDGNNVPGHVFTVDGKTARFPAAGDRFPDIGKNTIAHPISMGTYNGLQQSDAHSYWEFNAGTNWIFPHYEIIFSGGVPGTYAAGLQYENLRDLRTVIPGSGPRGITNDKIAYGDNPDDPRDPDRTEATDPRQCEFRLRFVPSAVDLEILYDVFVRVKSFRPEISDTAERFFLAFAHEVAKVDQNGDGAISFAEADVNGFSDGQPNTRLYLRPSAFNRFAVTREIDDGLLAPRFAPSERAYVVSGFLTSLRRPIGASVPIDADLR